MILTKHLSIWSRFGFIVKDLDISVGQGEVVLISGSSGSGKSLVLKILAGIAQILNPSISIKGEVKVLGLNPFDAYIKGLTFYIPQNLRFGLLFETVRDELIFKGINISKALKVFLDLGLRSDILRRPLNSLSAGEAYKSLIALAVLSRSRVILIDEPSAYLDSKSLHLMLKLLSSLAINKGISIIIADSHRQPYTGFVDREYIIRDKGYECEEVINEVLRNHRSNHKYEVILELLNIWFKYKGMVSWVIRGLTETLSEGDVVSIVGPTGSGKTTLARLAIGTHKPVKGTVKLRTHLNYVPQKPIYWFIYERVIDELKSSGLSERVLKYLSLKGKEHLNPYMLSVGEARILSLCIVYSKARGLVIIDEPTLGLDDGLRRCVIELINRASNQGIASLILTHEPQFALKLKGRVRRLDRQDFK